MLRRIWPKQWSRNHRRLIIWGSSRVSYLAQDRTVPGSILKSYTLTDIGPDEQQIMLNVAGR